MDEKEIFKKIMFAINGELVEPPCLKWVILDDKPKTEVIFNEPATVLYKDGKKYVCKCDKEDKFNEELGLAMCLLKSFGVSYSDFEEMLKGAKRQNKDKTLK